MANTTNYKCLCGNTTLRMVCSTGHKFEEATPWLCQCDECKHIIELYILEYNYKTNESNIVVNRTED